MGRFPVVLLELDSDDDGYDQTYQFRVDQVDEDQAYFATLERVERFILLHDLRVISLDEMDGIRGQLMDR